MAELIKSVILGYKLVFEDLTDPRTKTWFLVAKPYETLTLLALYLTFVLKWGPEMMRHRQAFNLDKIMIVYNGIQVLACGYIFVMGIIEAWGWRYKWICEPVDYSESQHATTVATLVYYYYMLKIADLADTIFFVLRKKKNQVSFLHLYHHTGMVMLIWGAITYFPGGHGTFVGIINSLVHCIMYSYYLLTIAVPAVKQSIAFKKFVTQIQIIQFFCIGLHVLVPVFISNCEYPRWTAAVMLPQNVFLITLFGDFYIKTYIKKPRQQQTQTDKSSIVHNDALNIVNKGYKKVAVVDEEALKENIQHLVISSRESDPNIVLRSLKRS